VRHFYKLILFVLNRFNLQMVYYYHFKTNLKFIFNHIHSLFNIYFYSPSHLINSDIIYVLRFAIGINFLNLLLNFIDLNNFHLIDYVVFNLYNFKFWNLTFQF